VGRHAAQLSEQLVVRLLATRARERLPVRQWVEPLVESAAAKPSGKNGNNSQTPKRRRPVVRMRTIGPW
jgi:hypothetical protein